MSFCGEHGTDGECSECVAEYYYDKINHLERQLAEAREDVKSYKYDLNTLVDIISDCVNKMSMEECYDTLKEVVDHYEQLKEQEPRTYLGGLVDEHCDLIKEQG